MVAQPVPEGERFGPPADLAPDALLVWNELAPLAFERGKLTKYYALAFRILCENVMVLRRHIASVHDAGEASHRGMIQKVEAALTVFDLRPNGKTEMSGEKVADVDPMEAKYFGSRA